jgi:hypothetical protein
MSAAEIERRVGLAPDDVMVRGSRTAAPPRPVHHRWEVRCDERGLGIDAQTEQVIARLGLTVRRSATSSTSSTTSSPL